MLNSTSRRYPQSIDFLFTYYSIAYRHQSLPRLPIIWLLSGPTHTLTHTFKHTIYICLKTLQLLVLYWVVKLSVWTKIHTSRPLNCFVVFLCCFNLSFITITENCIPLHTHRYVVFTPFLTDRSNCLIPILTLILIEKVFCCDIRWEKIVHYIVFLDH